MIRLTQKNELEQSLEQRWENNFLRKNSRKQIDLKYKTH